MVQLSHLYMTTEKTIALTKWTFVGKVISLLFNMLSMLVIAFLPRSRRLLISWLESPSAVILESKKIKSVTVSTVSPSICHEVMVLDSMILVFWMLCFKPAFRKLSKGAFLEDLLGFLQPCCVLLTYTPAVWWAEGKADTLEKGHHVKFGRGVVFFFVWLCFFGREDGRATWRVGP